MNSLNESRSSLMDNTSEESMSVDENSSKTIQQNYQQDRSRSHTTRSSAGSTNSNGTKRSKDISPCYVCGAQAHGYNFDQSNSIRTTDHNL